MTGVSQVLSLEQALGVAAGDDANIAFIESAIGGLEWGR
jgi:hypothetical protein